MIIRLFVCIFVFLSTNLNSADSRCKVIGENELCYVSVIHLISQPKYYEGKFVLVSGFYRKGWETTAIFSNRKYAEFNDGANGVWVSSSRYKIDKKQEEQMNSIYSILQSGGYNLLEKKEANNKYVKAVGIYKSGEEGHLGLYNGVIYGITKFIAHE
ncbi:MAG: hypothetical protein GY834_06210 [Bacteroidetes bacterium]|nr:hypothetical protein [Bacteroidota bacterium]